MNLSQGDRKLLLGGAGVFAVLLVLAVLLGGRSESKANFATSYSVASRGAKAAYLLLGQMGYRQQRWVHPLTALPKPGHHLLILADPHGMPTREQQAGLLRFLQGGGRVIITGTTASSSFVSLFIPEANIESPPQLDGTWQRLSARAPSAITRAAPTITMADTASWKGARLVVPLYGREDRIEVIRYPVGAGEVMWWAASTPLTNAGLNEPGNLEFFLASIGPRESTEVLWDEYFHGYQEREPVESWRAPLRWLLWQAAAMGIAVLLTFSRRSGPICVPRGEVRLSPMEFVRTLGGLYERARATSVAVDVCYQRFRYRLTRRLGAHANADVEQLERAVRERWGFEDPEFAGLMRACESARYYTDLPKGEALRLVRALYHYTDLLHLTQAVSKENVDGGGTQADRSHPK